MKLKPYNVSFFLFFLILVSCSFVTEGWCESITSGRFGPLAWSIGDWWIVESQVYNTGTINPKQIGWGPNIKWHFLVEREDAIENQLYLVVAIQPLNENPYPYYFRYWFRSADGYVGRYELYDAGNAGSKDPFTGPPARREDYPPTGAAPFFSIKFPALPMTFPLFNSDERMHSPAASGRKFITYQESEEIDGTVIAEKSHSKIRSKIEGILDKGNKLITVGSQDNMNESQYWNVNLPWPVYGELYDKTHISRRYWLIETGK